jgi:hypothetical protein
LLTGLISERNNTKITEKKITDFIKVLDKDGDQIVTKDEFVSGLIEYINQTKHALEKQSIPKVNMNKIYQVSSHFTL